MHGENPKLSSQSVYSMCISHPTQQNFTIHIKMTTVCNYSSFHNNFQA